jgi:SAM-dependent methyltransferase
VTFSELLQSYCHRIVKREPLVMYRFGDGERLLMSGSPVGEHTQAARIDRWQAPAGLTRLGRDLKTVITSGQGPIAHFGISCPCCDPASFEYYDDVVQVSPKFPANLFINANYPQWMAFIKEKLAQSGPVAVIVNERAVTINLPFEPVQTMRVPDDGVSHYETQGTILIAHARAFARGLPERCCVLVAAGPLSEALIFFMWNERPNLTYIDVGSSLDELTYGWQTRPYMDPTSSYAQQQCLLPQPRRTDFDPDDPFVSRFITRSDVSKRSIIVDLPATWWSRGHEYAWAQGFAEPDHVVLDAGCGISHPFKFWLASVCLRTYVCDIDERIVSDRDLMLDVALDLGAVAAGTLVELDLLPLILRARADLRDLPYASESFDRVFCISTLSTFDQPSLRQALAQMKRVLKPGGMAIVTFDVGAEGVVGRFVGTATDPAVGLQLAGPIEWMPTSDTLRSAQYGLSVYRLALKRSV